MFKEKEYRIFEMFKNDWAIVTSGNIDNFNSCTIIWGQLGTIWNKETLTVFIHPARYTSEFLTKNDFFTVSFFDEKYKKDLAYIGSHSGRNGNKINNTNLSPIEYENSVSFKEAKLTFLCKKLYAHQFNKDDLSKGIQDFYASALDTYPDFNGGWQPHIVFVGEIISCQQGTQQ